MTPISTSQTVNLNFSGLAAGSVGFEIGFWNLDDNVGGNQLVDLKIGGFDFPLGSGFPAPSGTNFLYTFGTRLGADILFLGGDSSGGDVTVSLTFVVGGSNPDPIGIDFAELSVHGDPAGATIQGNLVGTDFTGKVAIGNGGDGIDDPVGGNTIGGSLPGEGNVLSGQTAAGAAGLWVGGPVSDIGLSGTDGNDLVEGNRIGTDLDGLFALPNAIGVVLTSNQDTIGFAESGARNVISGNLGDGLFLIGSWFDLIEGNAIGTNLAGSTALPNGGAGVELQTSFDFDGNNNESIRGSALVTIGGSGALAGNILSGNTGAGVLLDTGAGSNLVLGNKIGTDYSGTTALGNAEGVFIDGAGGNTIGSNDPLSRNIISGNRGDGILLVNDGNDLIGGNFIGTDASGTFAVANAGAGIALGADATDLSQDDTIGGTLGFRNIISGNKGDGIVFRGQEQQVSVQGNFIGTDVTGSNPLGNLGSGVDFATSHPFNNTIGGSLAGQGNVIAYNGRAGAVTAGVLVAAGAIGDTISRDSIHNNVGLGINVGGHPDSGANSIVSISTFVTQPFPAAGDDDHRLDRRRPAPFTAYTIEFFSVADKDPTGFGEGGTFIGSTTAPTTDSKGDGTFSVTLPIFLGGHQIITATATDQSGTTGEFSLNLGEDRPPKAALAGDLTTAAGQSLKFDGTKSTDPDADPLTYAWDFGDGTTATGPTPSHTYSSVGTFLVQLTVSDPFGGRSTATLHVGVSDTAPTIDPSSFAAPDVFADPAAGDAFGSVVTPVFLGDPGDAGGRPLRRLRPDRRPERRRCGLPLRHDHPGPRPVRRRLAGRLHRPGRPGRRRLRVGRGGRRQRPGDRGPRDARRRRCGLPLRRRPLQRHLRPDARHARPPGRFGRRPGRLRRQPRRGRHAAAHRHPRQGHAGRPGRRGRLRLQRRPDEPRLLVPRPHRLRPGGRTLEATGFGSAVARVGLEHPRPLGPGRRQRPGLPARRGQRRHAADADGPRLQDRSDRFGAPLALAGTGTQIAVGAPGALNGGAVYLFGATTGVTLSVLSAPWNAGGDFGASVSASSDRVLVGDPLAVPLGEGQGGRGRLTSTTSRRSRLRERQPCCRSRSCRRRPRPSARAFGGLGRARLGDDLIVGSSSGSAYPLRHGEPAFGPERLDRRRDVGRLRPRSSSPAGSTIPGAARSHTVTIQWPRRLDRRSRPDPGRRLHLRGQPHRYAEDPLGGAPSRSSSRSRTRPGRSDTATTTVTVLANAPPVVTARPTSTRSARGQPVDPLRHGDRPGPGRHRDALTIDWATARRRRPSSSSRPEQPGPARRARSADDASLHPFDANIGLATRSRSAADDGDGGQAVVAQTLDRRATVPPRDLGRPTRLLRPELEISEGQPFTLSGSFTDPGPSDSHTVFIDWGDGTSDTDQLPRAGRLLVPGVAGPQVTDDNPADPDHRTTIRAARTRSGSPSPTPSAARTRPRRRSRSTTWRRRS